jgi:Fic family protein
MRPEDFAERAPGTLVRTDRDAWAFVPDLLPSEIDVDLQLTRLLADASLAIGALDGLGRALPNPNLLIHPFVRREAVASSRIEGTMANLGQLLLFEESAATAEPGSDVREVANYVRALEYGMSRPPERSITTRLIKEMHFLLMEDVRGGDRNPGEFRKIQNYIGRPGESISDARFVPPPPTEVDGLMLDFERSLAHQSMLPPLLRLSMVHYQFETIHPFLDGNGRLGRLLIPLLLREWNVMRYPQLLQLSDQLERSRDFYIEGLLMVSRTGDWDQWLQFFMKTIELQARRAFEQSNRVLELRESYRHRYQIDGGSTRIIQVVDQLFEHPSTSAAGIVERIHTSYPTAQRLIDRLVSDNVLTEMTGQRRNRVYLATEIVHILEADPDGEIG